MSGKVITEELRGLHQGLVARMTKARERGGGPAADKLLRKAALEAARRAGELLSNMVEAGQLRDELIAAVPVDHPNRWYQCFLAAVATHYKEGPDGERVRVPNLLQRTDASWRWEEQQASGPVDLVVDALERLADVVASSRNRALRAMFNSWASRHPANEKAKALTKLLNEIATEVPRPAGAPLTGQEVLTRATMLAMEATLFCPALFRLMLGSAREADDLPATVRDICTGVADLRDDLEECLASGMPLVIAAALAKAGWQNAGVDNPARDGWISVHERALDLARQFARVLAGPTESRHKWPAWAYRLAGEPLEQPPGDDADEEALYGYCEGVVERSRRFEPIGNIGAVWTEIKREYVLALAYLSESQPAVQVGGQLLLETERPPESSPVTSHSPDKAGGEPLGPKAGKSSDRRPKEWVGRALLILRDHPDWSDRDIAEAVGVAHTTIGRDHTMAEMRKLLAAERPAADRQQGRHGPRTRPAPAD